MLSRARRQVLLCAAHAAAPSGYLHMHLSKRSLTRGGAGPRHGTRPPRGRSLRAGQSESARAHLRGSGRWPVRAGIATQSHDVHKACLDRSQVALFCGPTVKIELLGFGVAHGRPVIPSRCGAKGALQVSHRHPGPPNLLYIIKKCCTSTRAGSLRVYPPDPVPASNTVARQSAAATRPPMRAMLLLPAKS